MRSILVTGSAGLIGRALAGALERRGQATTGCDLRAPPDSEARFDLLDATRLSAAMKGCSGVVHLAAVSRVLWGERDPHLCWRTNAEGTAAIVAAALRASERPWIVFASSREVYGQAASLPATEQAPLAPVNVYGRSKVAGEQAVLSAREAGLATAIVRLSNVYGSTDDHADRVVPAFARAAAQGAEIRVDGRDHVFDFTHLDDTVRGISAVVDALHSGERALPPVHLLTGVPTTLGALAELARAAGGDRARVVDGEPRSYDVARFVGDPTLAERLFGFRATVPINEGLQRLVGDFRALGGEEAP